MAPNLSTHLLCKFCKKQPPNIIENYAQGDLVCGDCGLVFEGRIVDARSEWRTFAGEDAGADPSRVGNAANPLLDGHDLSTNIGYKDGGTGIANSLARAQGQVTKHSSQRILQSAYRDISSLCEKIGLPRLVQDRAKQLFKKVVDENLLKGKSQEGIISACIYIACRQEKVARTIKEISTLTRVPIKLVGRCFKLLQKNMDTAMNVINTDDYISRFCSHLNLAHDIAVAAKWVVQAASENGAMSGRSPISIAATAIFHVVNLSGLETPTLKQVSDVSGVGEPTIKGAYRDIEARMDEMIPPKFAVKKTATAV